MPAMLVHGDSDMFRAEHIVEFYQTGALSWAERVAAH